MPPDPIQLVVAHESAERDEVLAAVEQVRTEGVRLEVHWATEPAALRELVRRAVHGGAERIIAGGGDGTANQVAELLVTLGGRPPGTALGILPLGTANDLSRTCDLPGEDLTECLRRACLGPRRRIDLGMANDRIFLNALSGGFGAEVTASTPPPLKEAVGDTAYALWGVVKAASLRAYPSRIVVDGQESAEGDWLILAVANGRFAGGGFEVAPEALLDDGKLELVVAPTPGSAGEGLSALSRQPEDPVHPLPGWVVSRKVREMTIDSSRPIPFTLDGEPFEASSVRVSVLPSSLDLVC